MYQSKYMLPRGHPLMTESIIDRCLDDYLFSFPNHLESQDPYWFEDEMSWTERELHDLETIWNLNTEELWT